MGGKHSSLRASSSAASLVGSFRSDEDLTDSCRHRSFHEMLVRERDKKHNFDDIYRILEEIGEGGLCKVYKIQKKDEKIGGSSRPEHVRHRSSFRLHRRQKSGGYNNNDASSGALRDRLDSSSSTQLYFALKIINLKMVKEDKIDQLKNEVEILKTMDHKNIIRAFETFNEKASRKLMIVMELCTGGDLYARIPYTEFQVAHITKQILSAVSYMHEKKIVHRDIKLENIVFESKHPEAPIKVIDFGLSKEYSPHEHILVERVGTLYSMAPETMKGSYDEKADLWSIGVCTYMLLAGGEKPFEGRSPKEMVAKVLVGKFEYTGQVWDVVSDLAKRFISDLLVTDKNLRPSAAQATEHKWIADYSRHGELQTEVDEAFKQRVRDCIISYAEASSFRKLALNVIAKRSTSDEIFQLRKVFDSFDTLNTGTITLDQFKEALSYQAAYSETDIEKIFRQVDVNGNNVINYTEFLASALEAQGELAEYRLAEAFDLMDSDDSGYISRENLRGILGQHSDEGYIDKLLSEVETKKNGKISYDDFLQVFSRHSQRRVSKIYDKVHDPSTSRDQEEVLKKHGIISSVLRSVNSVGTLYLLNQQNNHSNGNR